MDTMFTQLGQIFAPQPPRQAQASDTRQEIRRHDPDQERRHKKKGAAAEDEINLEDSTSVSISALRSFLEGFLKNLEQTAAPEQLGQPPENAQSHEIRKEFASHKPVSDKMARGISAYQNASKTTKPMKTQETIQTAERLGLHASDIRIIHELISDLKILEQAGQETITIERSESFLSSLVSAVSKAKTLLN